MTLPPRFEVLRRVGAGASGEVFQARDRTLDRVVAVKVFRPEARSLLPDAGARFSREARLVVDHPHPGVLPLLDAALEHDPPFLVMPWVDGGTLADRIARGPATLAEVRAVGARLGAALQHLHDQGVLHRDLKPENVLVQAPEGVYLADLGLGLGPNSEALTATGLVVGTPFYMAPETLASGIYSPRADQFSLAAVLLELAAGRRLRAPASIPDARDELLAGLGPSPLRQPLARALDLDPAARFDQVAALQRAVAGDSSAGPGPAASGASSRAGEAVAPAGVEAAPPKGRAAPPRRWPVVLAVLVASLVAGWLGSRLGDPVASVAEPSARDLLASEAWRRLEGALDRALGAHRDAQGTLHAALAGGDYLDHEAKVVADLSDPRYPVRWRRVFEALAALGRDPEVDPQVLDATLRDHLLVPVQHLALDHIVGRLFLFRVRTPMVQVVLGPPRRAADPAPEALGPIEARLEEARAEARRALEAVELLQRPAGPYAEVLRLYLVGVVVDEELEAAVRAALRRAQAGTDPRARAELLSAGFSCLPTLLHRGDVSMATRRDLFDAGLRLLRDRVADVPDRLRLDLGVKLASYWLSSGLRALDLEAQREVIRVGLEETARHLEASLPMALHCLTLAVHQQTTASLFSGGGEVGDAVDEALAELDRLRLRAREAILGEGVGREREGAPG